MDNWGFGIVGIGMIAEFHAKAIEALPNARVVAAYSRSIDKAQAFADDHGGTAYDDLAALLADPAVDLLTICTPSGFHAEPAIAAAAAGKHVICEKPIDVTLERIDEMIAAHKKAGTTLCGVFPYRYTEVMGVMQEAVSAGRFGRLTFGGAYVPWWRDQHYYDKGGWRGTLRFDGGGALMNQSIHAIDTLLWLMGDVETVTALTATLAHERIEVEDTAVASLRFKNGALGVIMGTTSIFPGSFRRLEVCGDRGTAVCVEKDLVTWQFAEPRATDDATRERFAAMTETGGGAADPAAISFEGHRRNFAACLAAIEAGEPAPVDGPEARRSVALILAIYESAAKGGQPVKLG